MTSVADYSVTRQKSHSPEWLFCLLVALTVLAGCSREPDPVQLAGSTMGTTWHVTYVEPRGSLGVDKVQAGIQKQLDVVNASMSTYLPDSEINRFNSLPVGERLPVSGDFARVLEAALDVGHRSTGAYDVTVAPLVNLWGFGPEGLVSEPPSSEIIAQAQMQVGMDKLKLEEAGLTRLAEVSLDFSSLAKGFAVDRVAEWLLEQGLGRFLVEVGGEIRLSGSSPRNTPWRIAIEEPREGARAIATALNVSDISVATSGDYRNFFEAGGKRYSHTIDPRTGYPVAHDLVSVTVLHEQAMYADAWATALTVLGAENAMAVALEQGLAVYFIRRTGDEFIHSHTPAFAPYLEQADNEETEG